MIDERLVRFFLVVLVMGVLCVLLYLWLEYDDETYITPPKRPASPSFPEGNAAVAPVAAPPAPVVSYPVYVPYTYKTPEQEEAERRVVYERQAKVDEERRQERERKRQEAEEAEERRRHSEAEYYRGLNEEAERNRQAALYLSTGAYGP